MKRIIALGLCLLLLVPLASCTDQLETPMDATAENNPGRYETPTPVFPMEDGETEASPASPAPAEDRAPAAEDETGMQPALTPDGEEPELLPEM